MQLEIPLDVVEAAAQVARAAGVTVILNAAPAQALPPGLLASVDYLVVNESEARLLAGVDAARPEDAARALLARGAGHVVVTLGEAGSLLLGRTARRSRRRVPRAGGGYDGGGRWLRGRLRGGAGGGPAGGGRAALGQCCGRASRHPRGRSPRCPRAGNWKRF